MYVVHQHPLININQKERDIINEYHQMKGREEEGGRAGRRREREGRRREREGKKEVGRGR